MRIKYLLQSLIQLFPVREQVIKLGLAQNAPEGGLCELTRGVEIVLHIEDGLLGDP